jgi:signal transduction histidine kinase
MERSTVIRELSVRAQRLAWAVLLTVLAVLSLVLLVLTVVSIVLIVVWVGLPLTVVCIALLRRLADAHRYFARKLLGVEVPSAYLRVDDRNFLRRPLALARDPSTWRDLVWLAVNSTVGLVLAIVAIVESILGLIFWWLPKSIALVIDAHITRALLVPSDRAQLAKRVQQLTESRAETVDTQAAELRRIERDLHDGAQARMVSLGMSLGMAEEQIERDPMQARRLLAEARATNIEALAELRDLVRGIHPPVLADRGLLGAVQALVLATPLPVTVQAELPGRLPAPVESAGYFAVAEALTNVIKHSGATAATIELGLVGDRLRMSVSDDGRGGADLSKGSGLRGIERRLSAFDGTLAVSSPDGGPTLITMELPFAPVEPGPTHDSAAAS